MPIQIGSCIVYEGQDCLIVPFEKNPGDGLVALMVIHPDGDSSLMDKYRWMNLSDLKGCTVSTNLNTEQAKKLDILRNIHCQAEAD